MNDTYMKIALGLEDEEAQKIVPLGAAKAVGIYDCQTGELAVIDISEDCEERLEIILKNASAIYHPIPKICPTIKEHAEQKGIAIKTGEWRTVDDLAKNLANLRDL